MALSILAHSRLAKANNIALNPRAMPEPFIFSAPDLQYDSAHPLGNGYGFPGNIYPVETWHVVEKACRRSICFCLSPISHAVKFGL